MFTQPLHAPHQPLPELPCGPEWRKVLSKLGVHIDPEGPDDALTQLTRYAVGWVERRPEYTAPDHATPVASSAYLDLFREHGFIEHINPQHTAYDYMVVDGGNTQRYGIRLSHIERLRKEGYPLSPNIIVFGGQSLRPLKEADDIALRDTAKRLYRTVHDWGRSWIDQEIAKQENNTDPWQRPFATEREIGLLSLLGVYGKELRHRETCWREAATTIDATIPIPHIAADRFRLGGDRSVTLLNAPARVREHAGVKMPLSEARPTGRSCFAEWLQLDSPPENSSVLFVTHAPNTYRSWFDMILRAAEANRPDLRIDATGAAIESNATVADVLEGLGNLIINFYNMTYEGGIDSPDSTPFVMR